MFDHFNDDDFKVILLRSDNRLLREKIDKVKETLTYWVEVTMKDYTDKQYGKKAITELLYSL